MQTELIILIVMSLIVFIPFSISMGVTIYYNKRIDRLNKKRVAKGKKPWKPKPIPKYYSEEIYNDGVNDILNVGVAIADVALKVAIHDKIYHNDSHSRNNNTDSYDDFNGGGGKFGGGGSSGDW